jgi:hypothetical protein
MITADVRVDARELQRAIKEFSALTKKTPVESVNQRTLNVARWAFEALPPSDPIQKSYQIKSYMDRVIVTKVRFNKSKGKIVERGRKHHLRLKHLIVQARRKKKGLKGLSGPALSAAAGELSRVAQVSVGYLKSVFLPIFVGLNPHVKFKMPFSKTKNIPRWKNSAGSGKATPAREGWTIMASLETNTGTSKPGQISKIADLQSEAMEFAIAKEENELRREIARRMRQNARRHAKVQ